MSQLIAGAVGGVVASFVSAIVAFIVARRNADAAESRLRIELQQAESRLRQEFAMESSLEVAVKTLMSKGYALRSFSLIRFHLRGFDDDTLRQLLIRSGCICFTVIDRVEYWGLLSENEHILMDREARERRGIKIYDLADEDELGDEDPDGGAA